MREHDARLLPAAGCAILTCAWGSSARGDWGAAVLAWCATLAVSVLAVALLARAARRPATGPPRWGLLRARDVALLVPFTCLLVTIVSATAAASAREHVPADIAAGVEAGARIEMVGVVVSDPRPAGRDVWTGVPRQAVTVAVQGACAGSCERVRAAHFTADVIAEGAMTVRLGDTVAVEGRASRSRDSRVVATVWDASVQVVDPARGALAAVGAVRASARTAAEPLADEVRGLVLGMVIGDTDQMPSDLSADMRTTSLTHLTAVSGSHFAIVVLVLGWVLTRVVRRRWLRAALLAGAMTALAAVVLPEPSVMRALTMAIAVALGWWWGRPARALPALGAGVLVLLLIEPGLGGAIGFQLSVVAVTSIVVWAPHLARRLSRWVAPTLARAVSIPLAAWLACWPLLVTLQPGLGLYAVPANLVAALAAFPVTVVGLFAMVVSLVWPGLGALGMQVAGVCAWPVVWAARAFSEAPGNWLVWPSGWAGVLLAGSVTGAVAFASTARRARGGLKVAVALVAGVSVVLAPVLTVRSGPVLDDWALVVCDVGQGDMMLVRVDEHAAVVIDTGPPGGAGVSCLRRYGVREIELLVLTHPHADHDGAVAEIAGVARIGEAWVSPAAVTVGHDAGTADARATGASVSVPGAGDQWVGGDVQILVLYPPRGSSAAASSSEINDASIALSIRAGPTTALAWADLEEAGQLAVASTLSPPVVVDLVKVAHHGSAVQSQDLATTVTSRVAAISVGEDNPYGHPHAGTVALYARTAVVMTTARCGDIALGKDGTVASACPTGVAG
ncbi:ComEC/Rec2 family competence protein [Demequina sp.]|uniref:ComEC/Rec2 family competence protein n=1 Tax=Demequina sp. TaxID=2050685 RepID=UPI0025BAD70D|nr:ComEC/Rec2 family competence protein [Demequina sp.]